MDLDRDPSPWRFLSPLHANDASDCDLVSRTRADELRIVTDMVSASRVSLLYAFSGNGKSSLINAGVVPHFRRLGYAVFKTRPRPPWSNHNPIRAFKDCLLRDMELPLFSQGEIMELREARDAVESLEEGSAQGIATVLDRLEVKISRFRLSSPAPEDFLVRLQGKLDCPLIQLVSEIRDYLGADTQMLFVCDQFEELFVHYNNSPELDEFVAQVAEVWAENSVKAHFLFSMREDWVGSMITFRKVIPDIFVSYYKLTPLGRKRAANVLTGPLERLHLSWETEAVDTVLNDLVLSYSENQTNRFNGIDLTPSPAEDPYLELPALQIVADRFWRTRDQHNPPFTLAHYRSLANGTPQESRMPADEHDESTSPAQNVLDSYLLDQLRQIQDGLPEPQALHEVRLDLLYLLTDRTRHRRALTETRLLAEIRQLRPRDLDLPAVDRSLLHQAIQPLVQMRLVTEHDTPDRQRQYELAHDFAVRSVVREWRKLDQERTAQLALLRRDREKKAQQLEGLVVRETRQLKFLRIAPVLGLLGLLVLLGMLSSGGVAREFVPVGSCLLATLFASVFALGASARQRWSLWSGVVGIFGVGVLLCAALPPSPTPVWGDADLVSFPAVLEGEISAYGDDDYFFFLLPRQVDLVATVAANPETGFVPSMTLYTLEGDRLMSHAYSNYGAENPLKLETSVGPGGCWLSVGSIYSSATSSGAYRISLGEAANTAEEARSAFREEEPNDEGGPSEIPWGISLATTLVLSLGALALLSLLYLRSLVDLNERISGSEKVRRVTRVMVAELFDILLVLLLFVGTLLILEALDFDSDAEVAFVLTVVFAAWLAFSTWALVRWKKTAGTWFCGLSVETDEGKSLPLGRAAARHALFLVWSASNLFLFMVPFLLVTSLVAWRSARRQNFFDNWIGSVVREVQTDPAGPGSTRPSAAPAPSIPDRT